MCKSVGRNPWKIWSRTHSLANDVKIEHQRDETKINHTPWCFEWCNDFGSHFVIPYLLVVNV